MKNLKLLIFIVTCASLFSSFSEMAIAETDPRTEYQNLQTRKYKDLQTELIYLLGRRVEEKDAKKGTTIGTKIMANLKQTNSSLDELAQLTPDDATKTELSNLKTILSFTSLSDPIQIAKIQESLNLTDKSKTFDKSTYEALKAKIEATGKKIVPSSSNAESNQNPEKSKDLDGKSAPQESNPTWFLPYLLSLFSTIGSGAAIFFVWKHNQRSQEKGNSKLNIFKNEVKSKIDRLESQNSTLSTNIGKLSQQISTESIRSSKGTTKQLPSYNENQDLYNINTHSVRETVPAPQSPLPRQSSLVDEYNQDPNVFKNRRSIQEVGEEQHNIEGRRSGQIKTVNLSPMERRRGGYWVLSHERQQIIVPSADLRVNDFNRDTTESIFDCINFNASYRKIILIQPAIVESISMGYQVISKGIIEFE